MADATVFGVRVRVSHRSGGATVKLESPQAITDIRSHAVPGLALSLHTRLAGIEAEWRAFEQEAVCTAFQTYDWLATWQSHVGVRSATSAAIVVGRDAEGRTLCIFPLAVERRWFGRRLAWLGSGLCDYNAPLLATALIARLDGERFPALWDEVLQLIDDHPRLRTDLVDLVKMPATIGEERNPFLTLGLAPESNSAYLANLGTDWNALYAGKRSGATRKRERRQFQHLAEFGEVRLVEPTATEEVERTLQLLFAQKASSFARMGIRNFLLRPGHREFFTDLATKALAGLTHVSRLDVGDAWAATNFGLEFRGRYYLLLSSYEHGELSRYGPGRAHMQALMRRAIERGVGRFDFTIGDEPYKLDWADTTIRLYGHFAARRLRGLPAVLGFAAFRRAKRAIRQSPRLWRLFCEARERIRHRRAD